MSNAIFPVTPPVNEPVQSYAPGSPERKSLKKRLDSMLAEPIEIPLIIGGKEVRTGEVAIAVCPHDHGHVLAKFHQAGAEQVAAAAAAAKKAWREWSETSWETRASVLLRAADLLAGPWRDTLNGATMLNQSKTVFQAEIDSACELIDFWRFNPYFMRGIYSDQPISPAGTWNRVEYRPLEGFVFAVTPFNFTSIGGNLPTAPALMANTVLWKPA
ncbi:MAG TPA: aldehyde dehydrogenase family protein, partial [Thermoanaerobaculia bacterium]|nr:aldehyde dehydrogenase family protein [Thermoanaerobaculia bacterium]